MNFFSHACVAAWQSEHPRFLLGAMLPDLTSMLGVRVAEVFDAELGAGVQHHHATDAAFHAAPLFNQLCSAGISTLCERGVQRGTSRAVAHVGVELLLDGVLSTDLDARVRYARALDHGNTQPWAPLLSLRDAGSVRELEGGISWLVSAPVPEGYRDPAFVAARLRSILGRRPRLAMQDSDFPRVLEWLHEVRSQVVDGHEQLLSQVRSALAISQSARELELVSRAGAT